MIIACYVCKMAYRKGYDKCWEYPEYVVFRKLMLDTLLRGETIHEGNCPKCYDMLTKGAP